MNEISKPDWAAATPDLTPFTQASSEAARRLCEHGQLVAKAVSDWNAEIGQFVSHRAARTGEAVARMAQCQNLPEILAVQTQWWHEATDDYIKQVTKLAEVNSRILGSLTGPSSER